MLPFLLILRQFGRAIRHAWHDPAFRFLAVVVAGVLAIGSSFYHYVEGWRWLDSLYFSVITLATVGYGDFTPKTDAGKIFTMLYIFTGIGLLVSIFTRLAEALLDAEQDRRRAGAGQRKRRKSPPG
ncbi:MAG: potassium channel family protein [Chloroflexota bacterium]